MTDLQISEKIIQCAFKVHSALGPGLFESAYEICLAHELQKAGFQLECQKNLPLVYDNLRMDCGYRMDIVVNNRFVLELKAVEDIAPIHYAQLITYLRISGLPYGLLLNFNVLHMRNGVRKVTNKKPPFNLPSTSM